MRLGFRASLAFAAVLPFAAQCGEAVWITPCAEKVSAAASFRRTFTNAGDVAAAQLRITSLGTFDAYLNGGRIGGDWLAPGFTQNEKCRHEVTYDISGSMARSAGAVNVLMVDVGPCWWLDSIVRAHRGKELALRATVRVTYADGRCESFPTGLDWQGTYDGPIAAAGIYEGEDYDARRVRTGWGSVRENTEFKGEVRPRPDGAAVMERADLEPKASLAEFMLEPGRTNVVDFSQNHAGVVSFDVDGPAGATVTVCFAEMLNDSGDPARGNDGPAGMPYLKNLRKARALFRYTLRGGGRECARPTMTYFGYRYAGFSCDRPVRVSKVRSHVLTSVADVRGRIRTGDERVNRLIANCEWGHVSNYLSVPTDCPQRDERLGWTGDTQIFCRTAMYRADALGFLSKWLADQRDAQRADGGISDDAPNGPWRTFYGECGWADSAVIVPYTLWRMYGDLSPVRDHWETMERHMDFLDANGGPLDRFCDWLSPVRNDPPFKALLCGAFWVWDARLMREMAQALGKQKSVARYEALETRTLAEWRGKHLDDGGAVKRELACQTANAYALYLDLLPTAKGRALTTKRLADDVKARGGRLGTGFLGTAVICQTLVKVGHADLAYDLLLNREYPGWLYSVDQGATTIWERWNSYTKDKGFGDARMNSFNHYAYGSVMGWLYEDAAGIRPLEPGFSEIEIAPHPDPRLGFLEAEHLTPHGWVRVRWAYGADGRLVWAYSTPAGIKVKVRPPHGAKLVDWKKKKRSES